MDTAHIFYIIFGVLALAVSLTLFLYKNRKTIRIAKMLSDFLWVMNYVFQGPAAYTGALQNIICMLREFVFLERVKERKWADSVWWCVLFCLFFAVMPIVTWQGWYCILPALGSSCSVIALYVKDEQLTRWLTIPAQLLCLGYSVCIGNVFSILGTTFILVSAVSGLILETWRRKQTD